MCIRDRGTARQQVAAGRVGQDRDETAEGFGGRAELPGAIPVSYTHLRAHETVLDLVCRLLLEQKKTTHTTNTVDY